MTTKTEERHTPSTMLEHGRAMSRAYTAIAKATGK